MKMPGAGNDAVCAIRCCNKDLLKTSELRETESAKTACAKKLSIVANVGDATAVILRITAAH